MGYFGEGQDVVFDGPVFPKTGTTKDDIFLQMKQNLVTLIDNK